MVPELSICIATRNRCAFIGETLQSIVSQCDGAAVEIVVLDGASTDDTESVVGRFTEIAPYIRYIRLEKNGGIDRDYDAAVAHAIGKYCWLMSDDDLLKPAAVEKVLAAISTGVALVVVNSEVRNFDLSKVLDPNRLRKSEDAVYEVWEFPRLFEETSAYLTYIGAVVIQRSIWMERERAAYFGSYFIHVGVIFQQPLPAKSYLIAQPLISIRFGNAQWRPKEFQIRMICWTDLIWSLSGIEESVRARCYRRSPWTSAKSLLFFRGKGTYDINDYRQWVLPRVTSFWDKRKAWFIARFPGWFANVIGLVYCSFGYRDSNIHLLDMKASRFYFRNWFKDSTMS